MIKELTYPEIEKFIPLLEEDPSLNLFFLNDFKLYKIEKDYKVFHTEGLLMMWFKKTCFVLFSYGKYDGDEVAAFINDKNPLSINGPKKALFPLEGKLKGEWETTYTPMMAITKESFIKKVKRSDNLSFLLTFEDFLETAELYSKDKGFSNGFETEEKRESWAYGMEEEMEYPYAACGYRVKHKLIGTAYLSAATKESAMVVGVLVDEDWRGGGIGTQLAQEITDIALNDHQIKRLCLFPSGDKAKHIYSKLGYKEVGDYALFNNLALKSNRDI